MATTNKDSSSRLLALGALVFVIGVVLVLLVLNQKSDTATPAPSGPIPTATPGPAETETSVVTLLDPLAPTSTYRIPRPLIIPEGFEAVAIRTDFIRGVAALPEPGDLVNLFRLPAPDASLTASDGTTTPANDDSAYAPPRPDAEPVMAAVEVLAVTGPTIALADGSPVFILAIRSSDVASLLPIIAANELWLTLLPREIEEPAQ